MLVRNELRIAIAVLVIGVVLALPAVVGRLQVEQAYRTYEVIVDFESLRVLAAREGLALTEAATALRKAGATSLSVEVQSVADLLTHGDAIFIPADVQGINNDIGKMQEFAVEGGRLFLPPGYSVQTGISSLTYGRTFVGLDPQAVATAKEAGLMLVPRVPFISRATTEEISQVFNIVDRFPGRPVLFEGDMILGYPDRLSSVSELLVAQGLLLGETEFSVQKGLSHLTKRHTNRLVRVHTITSEETDLVGFDTALARWVRAVQERNVRMLYFHPFLPHSVAIQGGEASALEVSEKMLREITEKLSAGGFQAGPVKLLPVFPLFDWGFLGALLGLVSLTYLMLRQILAKWWTQPIMLLTWGLAALVSLSLALLYFFGYAIIARQVVALGVAIVFPVMAVLISMTRARGVMLSFLQAVAILFAGVVLIVAALAQPEFILKTQQFLGVKMMHIIPPVVVAWILWQQGYLRGWSADRKVLLVLPLILVAGVYLVLRTGNVVAVADWERQARDVLERILIVRPRTKEFMLGHPALLAGLWLNAYTNNRAGAAALLIIGTIGLLSVLNTFTHIHTPLVVSALRTVNGLWLGLLIGLIGIVVLHFVSKEVQ